jgi:hypothetical protein
MALNDLHSLVKKKKKNPVEKRYRIIRGENNSDAGVQTRGEISFVIYIHLQFPETIINYLM